MYTVYVSDVRVTEHARNDSHFADCPRKNIRFRSDLDVLQRKINTVLIIISAQCTY